VLNKLFLWHEVLVLMNRVGGVDHNLTCWPQGPGSVLVLERWQISAITFSAEPMTGCLHIFSVFISTLKNLVLFCFANEYHQTKIDISYIFVVCLLNICLLYRIYTDRVIFHIGAMTDFHFCSSRSIWNELELQDLMSKSCSWQ